jgi:hypothetical protein
LVFVERKVNAPVVELIALTFATLPWVWVVMLVIAFCEPNKACAVGRSVMPVTT